MEAPAEVAPEGPTENDQAKPPTSKSCLDACLQRNMARAESAEKIASDCAQECEQDLPIAERAADLQLQSGRMLIIKGRLERSSGGFRLHLADGHEVQVKAKNPLSLESAVGGEAHVKGRYAETETGRFLSDAELAGLHMR